MANDAVLSDLCGACYTKLPKYRCPGCSAKTCSLPCYKRHQQLAQCSGKRDPAKYVSKGKLMTPAGVDHDYNFLSGIERAIDRASEIVEPRHTGQDAERRKLPVLGSNIEKALRETGVIIERAPTGMSRRKFNHTRWNKPSRCIMWTVEWMHEDGTRDTVDLRDITPIRCAYEELMTVKSSRKRKLATAVDSPSQKARTDETDRRGSISSISSSAQGVSKAVECTAKDDLDANFVAERAASYDLKTHPADEDLKSPKVESEESANAPYFYLRRPRGPGKLAVLALLNGDKVLSQCLKDQVILEFPTIQVLSSSPERLPDGFILAQDSLADAKSSPR